MSVGFVQGGPTIDTLFDSCATLLGGGLREWVGLASLMPLGGGCPMGQFGPAKGWAGKIFKEFRPPPFLAGFWAVGRVVDPSGGGSWVGGFGLGEKCPPPGGGVTP